MSTDRKNTSTDISFSQVISGNSLKIGNGFQAFSFREKDFQGAMDPLIMVDHYTMTEPTFGPHPHAGLSAVSVILEDSIGKFRNRDTIGNDFDLLPGDLYWLKAGSGIIHDESPRENATIHGLQIFVNLPLSQKQSAPDSLHVKAADIPVIEQNKTRLRVVLGEVNGMKGHSSPALPLTILDGKMAPEGQYDIPLKAGDHVWFYAIEGDLTINAAGESIILSSGQAIALQNQSDHADHQIQLSNGSVSNTRFAIFMGTPIKENFVQRGPFAMGSEAEIDQIQADYKAGKLGELTSHG